MSQPYKVFLSHKLARDAGFIVELVRKVARPHGFRIEVLSSGEATGNPADEVRHVLEAGSIEALLAVLSQDSGWIQNEIGMAHAFGLPVYVIADPNVEVSGIPQMVTSVRTVDVSDPGALRYALGEAFTRLRARIEQERRRLPEPPPPGAAVEVIRWCRFYEAVLGAAKEIMKDPDVIQRGFKPTLLVGISRGGIIVADLLSRLCGDLPLGLLVADRKAAAFEVAYADQPTRELLRCHLKELEPGQEARILIVDDVMKSGRSLHLAKAKVDALLAGLKVGRKHPWLVRSLVLILRGRPSPPLPDYHFLEVPEQTGVVLPYGLG